jgi:hypothetical protein
MPRWVPTGVPYAGRVPPAASEFPGLKFYLAFDAPADSGVREAVSNKAVGKLAGGQYVDGVRGKALRLTCDPHGPGPAGSLDLGDPKGGFAVPADEPFTLSLWFRAVAGGVNPLQGLAPAARVPHNRLFVGTGAVGDLTGVSVVLSQSEANRSTTSRWDGPRTAPSRWRHLAVVRDGNRAVRVLVDGAEVVRSEGTGQLAGPLDFDTLRGYVSPNLGVAVLDLDELCLFGQALTDEQIRRLAGSPGADAPTPPAAVVKGSGLKVYAGGPVPPVGEGKGLTFYLPCTSLADGKTPEVVSAADLVVPPGAELVDGVRGKALRFTPVAGDRIVAGMGYGMDVSGTAAMKAAAGKPFTLATWVRVVNVGRYHNTIVQARDGPRPVPTREFVIGAGSGGVELRIKNEDAAGPDRSILISGKTPEPGRWYHLAVTRDNGGRLRLLIDGVAVEAKKEPVFQSALRFDRVRLGGGPVGPPSMDLAEFCFFDRALTDAELKQLAGVK